MRALLIYPLFPPTFWSYEKILELVNRKVLLPPLGLASRAEICAFVHQLLVYHGEVKAIDSPYIIQRR